MMLTPEQIAADEATIQSAPNSILIAAARTRWPIYVEEVKRLREAAQKVAAAIKAYDAAQHDFCHKERALVMHECRNLADTLLPPKALSDPPCKPWPNCTECGMQSNFSLNGVVQDLCYDHHPKGRG